MNEDPDDVEPQPAAAVPSDEQATPATDFSVLDDHGPPDVGELTQEPGPSGRNVVTQPGQELSVGEE